MSRASRFPRSPMAWVLSWKPCRSAISAVSRRFSSVDLGKARGGGEVGVGLEEPGAVRAQGAVDLALDRAHREEVVAVAHHADVGPGARPFRRSSPRARPGAGAREGRPRRPAPGGPRCREARALVVERGDAVAEGLLAGQLHLPEEAGLPLLGGHASSAGLGRAGEPLGRLPQEPGGVAVGIADDRAALGVRGVGGRCRRPPWPGRSRTTRARSRG
jgi:hypothetical protein